MTLIIRPFTYSTIMVYHTSGLIALLFLAGCSTLDEGYRFELDDPSLSNDPALLVGTWAWVSSTSYYTSTGRPLTETAESTGRSETLVLRADGTAEQYFNGDLHREGTYTILHSGRHIGLFYITSPQFGVSDVKLVLSTAATDGPEKVYRRAQD